MERRRFGEFSPNLQNFEHPGSESNQLYAYMIWEYEKTYRKLRYVYENICGIVRKDEKEVLCLGYLQMMGTT